MTTTTLAIEVDGLLERVRQRTYVRLFDDISSALKGIVVDDVSGGGDMDVNRIRDYNVAAYALYQVALRDLDLLNWWCALDEKIRKHALKKKRHKEKI